LHGRTERGRQVSEDAEIRKKEKKNATTSIAGEKKGLGERVNQGRWPRQREKGNNRLVEEKTVVLGRWKEGDRSRRET